MEGRNKAFRFFTITVCVLLSLSLCCCGPSREYLRLKEEGYYPTTEDFPDTIWVCREVDITLNMYDYSEEYMVGEYTLEDTTYRVVAQFELDRLNFDFYSSTDISKSEYSADSGSALINCERVECGFVYTEYIYENDVIVCSVVNSDSDIWKYEGDTLTFEKAGEIAKTSNSRWYCKEIDMYIESFSDAKKYYKGKISINGKECYIHAFEIGNSDYYTFSIENGVINNLKKGTTSPLLCVFFEFEDEKIIGKITDDHLSGVDSNSDWVYDGTVLTFVKE